MHQVVFTGQLLKGADRSTVEAELRRLFKATPRQVQWFLRGKTIVVKSCEDAVLAARYFDALTKAGLECELRTDQPAVPSMSPTDEASAKPQQLPIPGVASKPEKPAPPTCQPVPRQPPTLGPVTQAITAQDSAPRFTAATVVPSVVTAPVAAPVARQSPRQMRTVFGLVFMLIGAVLVGALAYIVRQEWVARHAMAPVAEMAQSRQIPGIDTDRQQPVVSESEPQTPEALIVGRWQCVEASSGRVVENEFTADGRYRSLAHGRLDAFQQIDQMDVLVEGRYWIEGDVAVLHVQNIPSREVFGSSPGADDYLYWRIESLNRDSMVWADSQLEEVRESCMRSVSMQYKLD